MIVFNKLVRDKIPELIESEGRKVEMEILSEDKFRSELNKKLQEEVQEYLEDNNIEELADIVEVIYGILSSMKVSIEDFELVRKNKVLKKGGFEKRIYLKKSE